MELRSNPYERKEFMGNDIKPVWYIQRMKFGHYFRFHTLTKSLNPQKLEIYERYIPKNI